MSCHSRYSSLCGSNHPSTHSMNVDISLSHSRPFVSGDFDDHHCNESISTAGHLSDASHAPAPVHSTSSMPYSHYPGSTRNCVEDDYGSSAWHEPPNCSSVVAEVLQDDVVQNALICQLDFWNNRVRVWSTECKD
ncbi:hypothetical protein BU17DRAFT_72533 [Hysterangium stoloniferum]|nr:hypothetical protein BU17DRAFT_72533 [Hysterangium stoloniferum]